MGMFNDLHKQDLADKVKQSQETQPTKQALFFENKKASFQGSKQDLKQVASKSLRQDAQAQPDQFDITEEPYTQATFKFTDDELDALDDLKRVLKRQRNLRTTKQNLVRYALHRLIEE